MTVPLSQERLEEIRRDTERELGLRNDDCELPLDSYFNGVLELLAEVERQREIIQTAQRELERLSDVRANRQRIYGNVHLILQGKSPS